MGFWVWLKDVISSSIGVRRVFWGREVYSVLYVAGEVIFKTTGDTDEACSVEGYWEGCQGDDVEA